MKLIIVVPACLPPSLSLSPIVSPLFSFSFLRGAFYVFLAVRASVRWQLESTLAAAILMMSFAGVELARSCSRWSR